MKQPSRALFMQAALLALPLGICTAAAAQAAPTLSDYKYFRALSIDLMGRMPTRQEIEAFEKPAFSIDQWLDDHLKGPDYADRLTRVYADLLRPQFNNYQTNFPKATLARILIKDPAGKDVWVYYRPTTNRRARFAEVPTPLPKDPLDPINMKWNNLTRAGFCLLEEETGLRYPDFPKSATLPPGGTATPVSQQVLDKYTTTVKPWWLYADYKGQSPADRYDPTTWAQRFPGYVLTADLLKEPKPDGTAGMVDTTEIRICKEEASALLTATADTNKNLQVSCLSGYGANMSTSCGCGPGLEWCMPSVTYLTQFPRAAFVSSRNTLLGVDDPTDQVGVDYRTWQSLWMWQEPLVFLNHVFAEDRDFREVVTGRYTYVNGPLAQFYRYTARSNWADADYGGTPLPGDSALPQDLTPFDVFKWSKVEDRGPNSAGLITTPMFLFKNATRRARGHVVYNTFLCRDFVAPAGLQLPISKEQDLTKRAGCAACHQTLEPLAAYFSRLVETDWSWMDAKFYPVACKTMSGGLCNGRYDALFSSPTGFMLRGAYAAPDHADAGPAGLGAYLSEKPEFAGCVAQNLAQNFLGRDIRAEDQDLMQAMVSALTTSGYRVRPLMKVLMNSNAYRSANNLSPTVWRKGGGQ